MEIEKDVKEFLEKNPITKKDLEGFRNNLKLNCMQNLIGFRTSIIHLKDVEKQLEGMKDDVDKEEEELLKELGE
jgi:hypothetical protein